MTKSIRRVNLAPFWVKVTRQTLNPLHFSIKTMSEELERARDKTTGKTGYDNNLGYPEDITPTTVVSGGSVDVHIKRERPEK